MREQIELLGELQELDLIRKESAILHNDAPPPVDALDTRAGSLRDQIDRTLLTRYDRLIKQGLAVVEERGGMCMGCMLSIPVGDLNRMRAAKSESVCPNCGRFLSV